MTDSPSSLLSFVGASPSPSSSSFIPDPSQCEYDGLHYLRTEVPERLRKGGKVSKIWDFGNRYTGVSDDTKVGWKCALCPRTYLVPMANNNSFNIIRHLDTRHKVNLSKATVITAIPVRQQGSILHVLDVPAFRRNLLAWIVT